MARRCPGRRRPANARLPSWKGPWQTRLPQGACQNGTVLGFGEWSWGAVYKRVCQEAQLERERARGHPLPAKRPSKEGPGVASLALQRHPRGRCDFSATGLNGRVKKVQWPPEKALLGCFWDLNVLPPLQVFFFSYRFTTEPSPEPAQSVGSRENVLTSPTLSLGVVGGAGWGLPTFLVAPCSSKKKHSYELHPPFQGSFK